MPSYHFIRAGLFVLAWMWHAAAAAQAPGVPSSSFTIFLRAVPIGSEQISLQRTNEGWTITSTSRMGAPVDLVARLVEVKYTQDWKPTALSYDATLQGEALADRTTVSGVTATSQLTQGGRTTQLNDTIAPNAVLLPSPFWGPFEALSQRLRTAEPGSLIPAYVLQASVDIEVGESSEEMIQTASRTIAVRRTPVKIPNPGTVPLDVEVWGDETGRLLRISIPAQNIEVVREDIASVAARRVVVSRPGDEAARIPANGFTMAATISKPAASTGRALPAVILVSGSGPTDRDETLFGIPIFGQLANALADAGFIVVRYDKRGAGQSGGRTESATLADFSEDVRAAVRFTADRKDVDRRRIAVIGHSEGGSVAMLAAARENRIAALVLMGTSGATGAELNMYQVTHALERSGRPEAERQSTVELQKRIQNAVLTGSGWEGLSPAIRRQADTPWFRSFLSFDPAKVIPEIDRPILVLHGDLDTQVPPTNADRLASLANTRRRQPAAVVRLPGTNHLLVEATTGEVDEYPALKDKRVNPEVPRAIATWLQQTFAAIK
jgi:pimeloyl-ACP methyl ester carboxylesterase